MRWFSVSCASLFTLAACAFGGGVIEGTVEIKKARGLFRNVAPRDVIITLHSKALPRNTAAPVTHTVNMTDKVYLPGYLVIRPGDKITFRNNDPFKHNVFSLTEGSPFDLGLYGPEKRPEQAFPNPGLVKIYCNVHPDMACFVMVADTPKYSITGTDGAFSFRDLPPGDYELRAWNLRGEQRVKVAVRDGKTEALALRIDATVKKSAAHANKEGKKYPRSFDDGESY